MSNIVGIIDYGIAGNLHSIQKAVEKAGGLVKIITDKQDFDMVDKIILPGVGSFKDAMIRFSKDNFLEILKESIIAKPTLGICLGMQLLCKFGFEHGKTNGLDIINGEVKPLLVNAKLPHMGFNKICVVKQNKLLKGIENEEFYFMHSYEVLNLDDVIATTKYLDHSFVSAISKNNIYGVQFHPEKSKEPGIELFVNFIGLGE
ncbi:imidazole glycerol phosphate synthase subunit HisH [Campylobacter hyointestinalis]|uniref:imidazole glycerol phosphate synthase subunit HisH n=1 Tax=Campylobacter hyointestinalis TaxID=198 RepID=UPI000DCD687E|nr:imidazole glycerol phosphate synthase subunit HisH [Campylobacter hyointestinalis]RAZ44845.1 imidazole glycerol phosphate synthase subunit HisH [Campylobacter hyointestinalis subsp. lawsonii]